MVWLALAVVLPILYGLALSARRPPPIVDPLPASLAASTAAERTP
jgi:hypothetical protein